MKESWLMMRGWKMKLFGLYCRFIGWYLLALGPTFAGLVLVENYGNKWGYLLLPFWAGMLWIYPYMLMSTAIFYDSIKLGTIRHRGSR